MITIETKVSQTQEEGLNSAPVFATDLDMISNKCQTDSDDRLRRLNDA